MGFPLWPTRWLPGWGSTNAYEVSIQPTCSLSATGAIMKQADTLYDTHTCPLPQIDVTT